MAKNIVTTAAAGKRNLCRGIPEPLPSNRMLRRTLLASQVADLRQWDGPIKDQGDVGCCTGESEAETGEWIVRKYLPHLGPLTFSALFAYVNELIADGVFPEDDGSNGVTLCNTLIVNGLCQESLYPFGSGQIVQPTPLQIANAKLHRFIAAYHGLIGSETACSVLTDPTPWPVMMGFTCFQGLMSDECAETGILPMPKATDSPIGGHEVKASGCDVGLVPTIRPKKCPPAVLFMNSWGDSWGLKGYFWVPLAVLDAADTDLKIAHLGHPWKVVPPTPIPAPQPVPRPTPPTPAPTPAPQPTPKPTP
jgi:hypothetical protein